MSFLRPLLLGLLLGCSFIATASAAEPPSAKAVQQSLDALADRKLPEAEHNALKARLEQTLAYLTDRGGSQQKLEALQAKVRADQKQLAEDLGIANEPGKLEHPRNAW